MASARDPQPSSVGSTSVRTSSMSDGIEEPQSFEEGDRVAVMRLAPLTGEIQIVEATVVGMIDEYQAVIRFPGNEKESRGRSAT